MPTDTAHLESQARRTPVVDQIFGLNRAPIDEVLATDFADLAAEVRAHVQSAADLPSRVQSEGDYLAIGRYITDGRALVRRLDDIRTTEGRPMLEAKRGIDGFFNGLAGEIREPADALQKSADAYLRRVEAEKRAAAEAEARKLREQAEAERRKADEAKRAHTAARAEGRAEEFDAKADEAEATASASTADLTRMRGAGAHASAREVWKWQITDSDALYRSLGPLSPFMPQAAVDTALNAMARTQKARAVCPGVRFHADVASNFRGR